MRYDDGRMWRLNEQMCGMFRRENKQDLVWYGMGGNREKEE